MVFLVWCFSANEFNGSIVIYKQIILPFFMKHEKQINNAMHKVGRVVNDISTESGKFSEELRTNL